MNLEEPPSKIIHKTIYKNGLFPNNPFLPVLVYINCLDVNENGPEIVEKIFLSNGWKNLWRNSIYTFHHYHSNTHEVLGIYSGRCTVEAGGDNGVILELKKGDVFIIPAGVSHKNIDSSEDFKCVGAYPSETHYDMCYGKSSEHPRAEENIGKVPLPETDPVYGVSGPLFKYWKKIPSDE